MHTRLRIPLQTSAEQHARLQALQAAFAQACNALAPQVQQTRVWNRVALHHMGYRLLRDQFPSLGAQMACNVIYSVSRAARLVYQHPDSPLNLAKLGGKPLPLLRFAEHCPVYFDRHTLSLKDSQLSMYTLDGRIRFQLTLRPEDEAAFRTKKLRETVLTRNDAGAFELSFWFADEQGDEPPDTETKPGDNLSERDRIPEYLMVEKTA